MKRDEKAQVDPVFSSDIINDADMSDTPTCASCGKKHDSRDGVVTIVVTTYDSKTKAAKGRYLTACRDGICATALAASKGDVLLANFLPPSIAQDDDARTAYIEILDQLLGLEGYTSLDVVLCVLVNYLREIEPDGVRRTMDTMRDAVVRHHAHLYEVRSAAKSSDPIGATVGRG